ncbi:hypothetical protein Neosp_005488 [[Neocosmospora] mangrovei]
MLSASYGEQIQGDSEAALRRVSSQPTLPGPAITRSPSASKSRFRLSSAQAGILEDWARMNEEHPYPTESEKLVLQQHTSLSRTQVCNWFTNYRRKRKAALQKEHGSQLTAHHQGVQPIRVPTQPWESLDPLERWRQSPPEAEPAALGDISTALRTAGNWHSSVGSDGASSVQHSYMGSNPDTAPLWTLDLDNRVPSVASANSLESRLRRNKRKKPRNASDSIDRRFQCTFCTDRFKTKFDWARHEKTLHLSLETWTCPGTTSEELQHRVSSTPVCLFCDSKDTSADHYALHKPTACASVFDKTGARRLFFRKDHLRQHLRVAHDVQEISKTIQADWRSETTDLRSRCGFCNATFTTWDERVTHLVQEFRDGAEMRDWEGSRGFDPEVEERATLSMPPYLIDVDAKTQTPFSASDPWSILHHANLFPDENRLLCLSGGGDLEGHVENPFNHSGVVTYWEKIDLELGQWAQATMQQGIDLTDEMIQDQGRFMVYGNADPWNQTEADHPQWLADFKVKYGIEEQPSVVQPQEVTLGAEFRLFDMEPHVGETHYIISGFTQPTGIGLEAIGSQWEVNPASHLVTNQDQSG